MEWLVKLIIVQFAVFTLSGFLTATQGACDKEGSYGREESLRKAQSCGDPGWWNISRITYDPAPDATLLLHIKIGLHFPPLSGQSEHQQ